MYPSCCVKAAGYNPHKGGKKKMLNVNYGYVCPLCGYSYGRGPYHDWDEEMENTPVECPICRVPESATLPEVESEWYA